MVIKRGRRVLLECKYRPAQIVLIVKRERERETQEAWLLDLLNTNILSDSRRVTLDFLTFS